MSKQEDEVSPREAAAMLGASVETIYHYIRTGRIRARVERRALLGKRWWIRREDVEALKR